MILKNKQQSLFNMSYFSEKPEVFSVLYHTQKFMFNNFVQNYKKIFFLKIFFFIS